MKIVVIGQGYVGLPLALSFAECEAQPLVIGIDKNPDLVQTLLTKHSPFAHISDSRIAAALSSDRYRPTTAWAEATGADLFIICVPTPLAAGRVPNTCYIEEAALTLHRYIKPGCTVVLESTSYPGTTNGVLRYCLERSHLTAGRDFYLAFSPEREDPGMRSEMKDGGFQNTHFIPKLMGGVDPASTNRAATLYGMVFRYVERVSSPEVAEAAKLIENTYRAVNIAFVNELKTLFDGTGLDVDEILDAAATKPFGFTRFKTGPGIGGHCIPLDPFYLSWYAATQNKWLRFVELAGQINQSMPQYVVSKVIQKFGGVEGTNIVLLGAAYKADIDDDRESPTYPIRELLASLGAEVVIVDPYLEKKDSCNILSLTELKGWDADFAVLVTDHNLFRTQEFYDKYLRNVPVLDTRNALGDLVLSRSKA